MQLLYHNHDFEFEKIDGRYILDAYYEEISPDLLQTELDVCWVNVGGEKPPRIYPQIFRQSSHCAFKGFHRPEKREYVRPDRR